MNNYVIYTDSACDVKPELLSEWGVKYSCLTFHFNDAPTEYSNDDMDINTFYDKMRAGGIAKTSAVNSETFASEFEKILAEGKDILYIGFSSGLSTTYNSGHVAAEQLKEKYPERKILTVDTLAGSAGEGLLVCLAAKKQKEGASIEETAEYIESIKLNICHWVTVDDLVYLKRGGRISPTVAFVGNTLGIKPLIKVDNEGHLDNVAKVRGRKNAFNTLINKYSETAIDPKNGPVVISHSDCLDEAEALAKALKDKHGVDVEFISDIGPVIGAHTGPGTLVIFFLGKER
ncbi:MAG: DegV family protein [Clostridia bacterium]|nr:DegV family protein [Clostridia bacterium]